MTKQICFLLFVLLSMQGFAQTGIGTSTPDPSAKLEVNSNNKGFLPPRIALTALNSAGPVTNPATGLLIFNTATAGIIPNQVTPGYYYWDGVNLKWVRLEDKADNLGNHTATDNIRLNGYYLSNDGGNEGIRVDNSGNVGIGTTSPAAKLHLSNSGAAGLELSPTAGASGGTFIQAYNRSTSASVPLDIYASQIVFLANDAERMRVTSGGNVGIGTNAPSSTALLDLTSASKGLLPPRVALTSKSGTSTPIASPTNGLLIYNTVNAGSGGDAVTPGYYYFNGTFWTRMDPEGWSTPVSITIGATTTAPSKGTATTDYVRYRNIGGKEYEVEYNLVRTVAGSAGSGDYLISLPGGLQFDFTAPGQRAYTLGAGYNAIIARLVDVVGDLYTTAAHNSATVIPYNATSFRVHTNNWGTVGWTFWNASYYQLAEGSSGFKMTFRFTAI